MKCLHTSMAIILALTTGLAPHTCTGMQHDFTQERIIACLTHKEKTGLLDNRHTTQDLFYSFSYAPEELRQGGHDYNNQRLLPYPKTIQFADDALQKIEQKFASFSDKEQQQFCRFFEDAIKNITLLQKLPAQEIDIQKVVTQQYEKLEPLVWRTKLLWFLRHTTGEMYGDVMHELWNCAPCKQKFAKVACLLLWSLYSYHCSLRNVLSEESAVRCFTIFCLCMIGFYYDIIVTSQENYAQAQEFINEKLHTYNTWKKITDELAQKMAHTYQTK